MKRALNSAPASEEASNSDTESKKTRTEEIVVVPSPSQANIITQMMDIAEPLSTLKKLLELRLQCNLTEHEIYLQNTTLLESDKSLLEQNVNADGMVQFSVQVTTTQGSKPRINIVDIVKPIVEPIEVTVDSGATEIIQETVTTTAEKPEAMAEEGEQVTRWIVCGNYKQEQEKLGIPFDPLEWTTEQTIYWLKWASKEFSTVLGPEAEGLKVSGDILCTMPKEHFIRKFTSRSTGEIFWTHLELLRKSLNVIEEDMEISSVKPAATHRRTHAPRISGGDERTPPGNRTGNNGQIQLWQFLLELLTDKDSRGLITWVGDNGEFRLNNPELVAQKWGQRKNKPTMNYEKLSRALRYYYDGDMIAKVHGKRFMYKFICNLKQLIGYSAAELNRLVTECEQKKLNQSH